MCEVLEAVMLICFGCSWPINLIKNYRCRSAKGMSLSFILLLIVGYVAGITAKLMNGVTAQNAFVLVVYLLNLGMVTANLFVYFRNRALDRKAELCTPRGADSPEYAQMAASVSRQAKETSRPKKRSSFRPQAAGTAAYGDFLSWGKSFEE